MSGPSFTRWGDVVSSSLSYTAPPNAKTDLNSNFAVMLGQIEAVYGAGDQTIDNAELQRFVLYDVRVRHPDNTSEVIQNCRMLQPSFGGGFNNYLEVLSSDPGPNSNDQTLSMQDKRGHFCLVAFISGQKNSGVIMGMMPHTNEVAVATRPDSSKGTYLEGEVQGLNFKIDNDGALTIAFNGPYDDNGELVQQDIGPTTIAIDKTGNFKVSTNDDAAQSISVDRVTKKIIITNGEKQTITMDKDSDTISVVSKIVEVGKDTLEPMVCGDTWQSLMEELIDEITQIYVPTGVGPSGTPINTPKFMLIKNKLKKCLSKNHKVEL